MQIREFFNRKMVWLLLLPLVHWLIHVPYMSIPAVGHHVWRQANTLAVAKNYATEDMNILYPRIDKNYGTDGITGPQFTSYDYTLAVLYKIGGFSQTTHRYLSLGISILALWGCFMLFLHYLKKVLYAGFAAFAVMGIPEFYYYSIAAVPDILALAAMVWGWWFFYGFLDKGKWSSALFSALLLALAGMTKLMFLLPGFVILAELIQRKIKPGKIWIGTAFIGGLALAGSVAWYMWARYLTQIHGLLEFVHQIGFLQTQQEVLNAIVKNLFVDTVETWVGYPLLIPFFGGLFLLVKRKHDLRFWFMAAAAIMYYVVMQRQLVVHGYYMLLFMPVIGLSAGFFMRELKTMKGQYLVMALIFLSPVWAWARVKHNWNPKDYRVPIEIVDENNQDSLHKLSGNSSQWIVGPDQTGCVYFYYLQAKGYPWYNFGDSSSEFVKFRKNGARGFITNEHIALNKYIQSLGWRVKVVGELGSFKWYEWDDSKDSMYKEVIYK